MVKQGSIKTVVNSLWSSQAVLGLLLLFCSNATAHNANLSTFRIVQGEQGWTLEAHVARHTLDYGYGQHHPDNKAASAHSLEQWFITQLQNSITISDSSANPVQLLLEEVSMGGHQCVALFKLSGLVPSPKELHVHIDSFSDNPDHTNIARVFHQSEKFDGKLRKMKKALSQRNSYQHVFVLAKTD